MVAGNDPKNPRRMRLLALALAAGKTVREASNEAGVGERTVYRALKRPRFVARVRAIQGEMRQAVVGRLTEVCTEAVQTLRELLGDDHPATARLGAARAILEHAARMATTVDLESRIAQLEQQSSEAAMVA